MAATTLQRLPALPPDRALPGAADLLGPEGVGRVTGFLEHHGVEPHRVEPAQAHYRPGRWLAVCYRTAGVDRSSGAPVCSTVVAEHRAGDPEGLWVFPDDPVLPGLPAATNPAAVARLLGVLPGEVTVDPIRYRPRRRAVLRYRLVDGRARFGKVVTPARAKRLLALAEVLGHRFVGPPPGRPGQRSGAALSACGLSFALPVGRIGRGALLLPCARGRSLRHLLLAGGVLPNPARLAGLPADIHGACGPALAGAPGLVDPRGLRRFDPVVTLAAAKRVTRLLPACGAAAARLADAVIGCAEASDAPDEWIVHGDLYENQVLVHGDRLTLIDLDDVGPGDPVLDAANFSAHLLLLATSGGPAGDLIGGYRAEFRAASVRAFEVAPAELAWREAYCLLRLVSGPFRVLHPEWPARMAARLDLAVGALSV